MKHYFAKSLINMSQYSTFLTNLPYDFWWWLEHRWYARPKATQFFAIAVPTIITGAALIVAWSQREIAANKYRMDLYLARMKILEGLNNEFTSIGINDKNNKFDYESIKDQEEKFMEIQLFRNRVELNSDIFGNVSLEEFNKTFLEWAPAHHRYIQTLHEISQVNFKIKMWDEKKLILDSSGKWVSLKDEKKSIINELEEKLRKCEAEQKDALEKSNDKFSSFFVEIFIILMNFKKELHMPLVPFSDTIVDKLLKSFFHRFSKSSQEEAS